MLLRFSSYCLLELCLTFDVKKILGEWSTSGSSLIMVIFFSSLILLRFFSLNAIDIVFGKHLTDK